MIIEIIAKHDRFPPDMPYDFEIDSRDGALRDFCKFCKNNLSQQEKWFKDSLLTAMRISLFLHGRVRIVYCGHCDEYSCGHTLKQWLKAHGPLQIQCGPFQFKPPPFHIKNPGASPLA